MGNVTGNERRKHLLILAVALGLAVSGLYLRYLGGASAVQEDRLVLRDSDTQRRLVRLENLSDPDKPYPYLNLDDGSPEGTVIHWTLPMDGVILALDGLLDGSYPQARSFEAGAMWSGPVLGSISVLIFSLLVMAWLGLARGAACAVVFSTTLSQLGSTALGLGDHQSLQLLCASVAVPSFLMIIAGSGGRPVAVLVGLAMGLGLWSSAELTILFHLLALCTALAVWLSPAESRQRCVRLHLIWTLVCLGVCLIAAKIENPAHWWVFEWDRISHFQAWQVAVLALFLGLSKPMGRRIQNQRWVLPLAAAVALLVGGLPFLLPPLHGALAEQLRLAGEVNQWAQNAVNEFRPLLSYRDVFFLGQAVDLLGPALYLLPFALLGLIMHRGLLLALRVTLLLILLGLLALGCWEVKLLPFFGIVFPVALVLGGSWWLDPQRQFTLPRWAGPALVIGFVVFSLAPHRGMFGKQTLQATEDEKLAFWLRDRLERDGEQGAVLAPWDLGAELMYLAGAEVVASNYHRNIAGIHDGYRFLLMDNWAEASELLRRRQVRWIVSCPNQEILLQAHEVLEPSSPHLVVDGATMQERPGGGLAAVPNLRLLPSVARTMFWRLNYYVEPEFDEELAPRLSLEYESRTGGLRIIGRDKKPGEIPWFRVYRVEQY